MRWRTRPGPRHRCTPSRGSESLVLGDVVDATDVRVSELPGDAHLGEEPFASDRIVREGLGQKLQRRLAELHIVGSIDLAHSAAAKQPNDAVAIRQDDSRREAAHGDRIRGDGARDAWWRPCITTFVGACEKT